MSDEWRDWEDEPPPPRWRRGAVIAAVLVALIGGGYGIFRFIGGLGGGTSKPVMEVVTLKLIQPPPPPPPPPVQKPPEPAKMLEQPQEKLPDKPKQAEKPPQNLAVDAKGQHGGDSFGLAGRPGGAPLIGGDGGGSGGSRFGWYANLIQGEIQRLLQKDEKLRTGRYGVTVAVWLSANGRPDRVKLISTTGDRQVDQRIEETLAAMPNLPQAPPHDMPQPVNLRIDARPTQ